MCSEFCFVRFRKANNLIVASCLNCGNYCFNKPLSLKIEDSTKTLCNAECLAKFKEVWKITHLLKEHVTSPSSLLPLIALDLVEFILCSPCPLYLFICRLEEGTHDLSSVLLIFGCWLFSMLAMLACSWCQHFSSFCCCSVTFFWVQAFTKCLKCKNVNVKWGKI